MGVHGGATTTDSDGNVLKHDHKAGVDITRDKVIVTGSTDFPIDEFSPARLVTRR